MGTKASKEKKEKKIQIKKELGDLGLLRQRWDALVKDYRKRLQPQMLVIELDSIRIQSEQHLHHESGVDLSVLEDVLSELGKHERTCAIFEAQLERQSPDPPGPQDPGVIETSNLNALPLTVI